MNEMLKPAVTITWCAEDVKTIHEDWSDEKCIQAIDYAAKTLTSRSIELGWDVLEDLVSMFEDDNQATAGER